MRALSSAAPLFAALGDETRLEIVDRLCSQGPQSITRLTDGTRVTRQAVSKHLQALAAAGVIISRREGRERIWQIQTKRLNEARRQLDRISAHWDDALERLRAAVERDV